MSHANARAIEPAGATHSDIALGYGYLNDEFIVTDLTPAAASILRRRVDEVVGRPLDTLLLEVEPDEFDFEAGEAQGARRLRTAGTDSTALGQQYVLRETGEQTVHLRLFVVPTVPKPSKHLSGSIFIVEDISSLKACEALARQDQIELAHQQSYWQRLFRNASHDMREPLRMACTYTSLLQVENAQQLDETGKEYLAFALEGATRLRKQTESLLKLLSLEFQKYEFQPVSMQDALECAQNALTPKLRQSRLTIEAEPLPVVWGNNVLLSDLMEALLDNAIKFTREHDAPKIRVSCQVQGSQAIFTISDNGPGVAAERLEEIFDPFRRLHGREQFPGEGLGLTLGKRIVQLHGGKIWADNSAQGFHLYFTLALPSASGVSTLNG